MSTITTPRVDSIEQMCYSDGYLTVDLGPWHFHLCMDTYYRPRAQFPGEPMPADIEAVAQQRLPETV